MGRSRVALGVVVALLAALAVALPAAEAAPAPAVRVPVLRWTACGDGLQCATATVPLDHDAPNGPTIELALARRPADDQAHRIGSMFVNPGGPGGSGAAVVGAAEFLWSPKVLSRFDVVGFDPRGVARSTPLRCFPSNQAANQFLAGTPFFPYLDSQFAPYVETFRRYGQRCLRDGGAILRHMSTADVAHDMDLLRQAVGDAEAHLRRRVVRLVPRQRLRQPLPWQGAGADRRRRARPGGVGDRSAAERCLAAVLHPARVGPRCRWDAGALLRPVRRGRAGAVRLRSGLAHEVRPPRRSSEAWAHPERPRGGPLTYDVFNNIVLRQALRLLRAGTASRRRSRRSTTPRSRRPPPPRPRLRHCRPRRSRTTTASTRSSGSRAPTR